MDIENGPRVLWPMEKDLVALFTQPGYLFEIDLLDLLLQFKDGTKANGVSAADFVD
jgi:hypothetical protein